MHKGKVGQFFEVWVFPAVDVGLCVDGPHNTAGDPQNTPGTPAVHFPLGASGSIPICPVLQGYKSLVGQPNWKDHSTVATAQEACASNAPSNLVVFPTDRPNYGIARYCEVAQLHQS